MMRHDKVGSVMTSEVVRATRDTTFREMVRLLDQYRISGLPVVDDDERVIGVISQTDLLARAAQVEERPSPRHRFRWSALAGRDQTDSNVQTLTAGELMSHPAIAVYADQSIALAARAMAEKRIERLPVVDEEDRLVGIVTRRDLLQLFLQPDAEIRRTIVHDVLDRTLWLPPGTIDAEVQDGVVTLSGRLETRSETLVVLRLAKEIDGVVDVVNHLTYQYDDTRRGQADGQSPPSDAEAELPTYDRGA